MKLTLKVALQALMNPKGVDVLRTYIASIPGRNELPNLLVLQLQAFTQLL